MTALAVFVLCVCSAGFVELWHRARDHARQREEFAESMAALRRATESIDIDNPKTRKGLDQIWREIEIELDLRDGA